MGSRDVLSDVNGAVDLVNYVRGTDASGYRNRTVTYDGVTGVWKLGDIIASTPKIQSGVKLQNYDVSVYGGGYDDVSYFNFTDTTAYKQRGMAYVGANDGMLHAFNIGSFGKGAPNTDEVSVITGTNIGREEWAFIPIQALPYLKYLREVDYTHLYYMDTSPTLLDASINKSSTLPTDKTCESSTPYWDCYKDLNSWRSVLIGGMGLGGASRIKNSTCTNCVKTPITDPDNASKGVGYSSYFSLDITDPANPGLLWEFANPALGFATSGPAIVRVGDPAKNGRWFAVFASGPTGPIDTDTHQFLGRSDQNLRLFVLDLATGSLVKTIDTGIANAFGGSMLNSTLDTDKFNGRDGKYTDDMLYVGYVRESVDAVTGTGTGVWDQGGVIRLTTRDFLNTSANSYSPDNPGWVANKVIDGVGPVTSGIGRIIDRQSGKLWLYFGTGRYYYRTIGSSDLDGAGHQLALYGITDPCFQNNDLNDDCAIDSSQALDPSTDLLDQTTSISSTLGTSKGWFINLEQRNDTDGFFAERVITDPVAASNGLVYFTSFMPSQDTCSFSGDTFLWVVKYDTGGAIPTALKSGKIVLQVSTGAFQEVDIATAFTQRGGRATTGLGGIPSGAGTAPSIISNAGMTPVRKILHVRER
jgi:type IV pilus assembly protein PilY1